MNALDTNQPIAPTNSNNQLDETKPINSPMAAPEVVPPKQEPSDKPTAKKMSPSDRQKNRRKGEAKKAIARNPNRKPPNAQVSNNKNITTETPKRRRGFGKISFLIFVIIPTAIAAYYYAQIASDQYQSEMRFSVRGTNTTPLDTLGLSAIPGNSIQAADAYIVIEYMTSLQILNDMRTKLGTDARSFFSTDDIDFAYRIAPDMPMEEFVYYWQWMTDASFNSTTGITTFRVNAFTGPKSGEITKSVLKLATDLVNDLSTEARGQLIETARIEVTRTEERLTQARREIQKFRNKEQSLNPTLQATSDLELIQGLQRELINLRARRSALTATVESTSPSVRVIDRQIEAIRTQLEAQKQAIGSGASITDDKNRNLSDVLSEYSDLELEEQFAQTAYTTALASLETSQTEARKQERYFAIVVQPTTPLVALHPYRIVNTIIAFGVFFIFWLLTYLVVQAIRDHAV